ncbi:CDP-diacylglycerol--glycerol-3-phosphate 3-phosphatidyltransferase [Singulisphaera sp. Ch08]|uniref:CDP-diacylglycerol--glycerol-3-phosphate 3-phosphatidyltransferase n=1 Tax=Singulisphaera sp. Ch08 TaxID=3120278 RepID=A0AAU7CRN8_9BACT
MAVPAEARFWNVPNTLTMSRLVLAVVVFALIAYGQYLPALAVFGIASLTDALDGYFARLLNQGTPLGRQLDPLVDKVIVSGAYIYLLSVPHTGVQPWMVTTIVVREMLIQGLRSHLEGQGQAFGAAMAGKLKTLVQCLSISAILLSLAIPTTNDIWILVRDGLTWLAVALTIYSGLGYVVMAMPIMRKKTSTT